MWRLRTILAGYAARLSRRLATVGPASGMSAPAKPGYGPASTAAPSRKPDAMRLRDDLCAELARLQRQHRATLACEARLKAVVHSILARQG